MLNLFKVILSVMLLTSILALPTKQRQAKSFLLRQPDLTTSFLATTKNRQDFAQALVIDNGRGYTKGGLPGGDTPRSVFPSVVGTPKRIIVGPITDWVGEKALANSATLTNRYPIERNGQVSSWDNMEILWRYLFNSELKVSPGGHPILMTGRIVEQRDHREKIAQILFKKFNVPALNFVSPAVAALQASGRTTGVVVQIGDSDFSIVPVVEGSVLSYAEVKGGVNGMDLTDYLMKLLTERGITFATSTGKQTVRDLKEKLSYVALDLEDEMQKAAQDGGLERNYELPDGQLITVSTERFRCPEVLFNPSLIGSESDGVHTALYNSIMNTDPSTQEALYGNIILAGGSTLFEGLAERLEKEIRMLAPASMAVNVVAPPERKYSTWIGGSMLASSFQQESWITREEYDQEGVSVLDRKDYYQTV